MEIIRVDGQTDGELGSRAWKTRNISSGQCIDPLMWIYQFEEISSWFKQNKWIEIARGRGFVDSSNRGVCGIVPSSNWLKRNHLRLCNGLSQYRICARRAAVVLTYQCVNIYMRLFVFSAVCLFVCSVFRKPAYVLLFLKNLSFPFFSPLVACRKCKRLIFWRMKFGNKKS